MKAYIDWIVAEALPRWASDGFDPERGRFHERLDQAARPIAVPHRSMVQARQISVFSHAARLGWFPEGATFAETAMAALRRDFAEDGAAEASFAFSIDPASGATISAVRDAYGHAFVLFAIAHLYALNGDAGLLTLAERTTAFIDRGLHDPEHGGLFDAHPVTTRDKRQNPQMHLLEAYLALEEAAPGRGYGERAEAIVALFREQMFDAGRGVLPEYFGEDWSPHADPVRAAISEPGHHHEWIWLLAQHERITGTKCAEWRAHLAATLHHGRTADGLIHDELGENLTVVKRSHRVWPHTEAIKSAVVRYAEGELGARAEAEALGDALLSHFLDRPFAGGWIDHIAPDRRPLVDYVPASSLYHLHLAAAEARALMPQSLSTKD